MVTWAERGKVSEPTIRAVLTRDFERMPQEVALAVRFTEASLARELEADELREQIRAKWGDRAIITLAYAITAGQLFPTLKYALGFGRSCSLVQVGDELVQVRHEAPKILQAI